MHKLTFWVLTAAACISAASAQQQQQQQPVYVQHYCIKATPGKLSALASTIPDLAKYMQVRVDSGEMVNFIISRAVIPAGATARCDYILAYVFRGFPPEPSRSEYLQESYKKANLGMSYSAMLARRDEVSTLVSDDLFRIVEGGAAGTLPGKGGYVRINLYKVKPGHTLGEWAKLETTGWKPYADAMSQDRKQYGWRAETLLAPTGTSVPYNAMTVDLFANWAAISEGNSLELWNKAHPDLKWNDYMTKVGDTAERYRTELYRIVEFLRPKQ